MLAISFSSLFYHEIRPEKVAKTNRDSYSSFAVFLISTNSGVVKQQPNPEPPLKGFCIAFSSKKGSGTSSRLLPRKFANLTFFGLVCRNHSWQMLGLMLALRKGGNTSQEAGLLATRRRKSWNKGSQRPWQVCWSVGNQQKVGPCWGNPN